MSFSKYIEELKDIPFNEITIGLTTIYIFSEDKINENQIGYSVDSEDQSLVGESNGDWKKNWLVIGCESLCGDPLFIDIETENFPVFTAMHGVGSWDGKLIADNFKSFIKSLEIAAKCNTKEFCLEEIKTLNKMSDFEFLEVLFEE
jgi:hypothetical protein